MDDALVREYKEQRAQHPTYPAHVCFAIACDLVKYRSLPTEWEQGGFDIKVTSDYDDDYYTGMLDHIGKLSDHYEDGPTSSIESVVATRCPAPSSRTRTPTPTIARPAMSSPRPSIGPSSSHSRR